MLNIWCAKTGKMCLPDGKKFYDLYVAVWTEYRRVTDGQTKGQTDRQTIIFSQHIVRTMHTRRAVKQYFVLAM